MDLTITYPTFFKNLKFWGFHTIINSIPSMFIAAMHDWNRPESFIAMALGIIIFALILTYFMSMKDIHTYCTTGTMARALRAGTYLRFILFLIAIPGFISFFIFFYAGNEALAKFASFTGLLWAPDFVIGIVSHTFYGELRSILPFRGIHGFFPTITLTILQGIFLMAMLVAAGLLLAAIGLGKEKNNRTFLPKIA
ncbi:MAG: hypothetical protein ACSHX6_02625 [Akkermansiaceae bacterium]